jgi:hypothetical protein
MTNRKFFTDPEETVLVDLEDGQWVRIKAQFSVADQDYVNQRLFDTEVEQGSRGQGRQGRALARQKSREEGTRTKFNFRPSTQVVLERAIRSWSFDLPLTPENIGNLLPEVAALIEDAVNDRNPFVPNTPPSTDSSSSDDQQLTFPGKQLDT